jgi:hypothetical protein
MFSTNSGVETHEMRRTRLGRLALHKGEGEGPVPARRLEHFEVVFFGSNTPHLNPFPFRKGRGDKTHACGYLWHPRPREVA